MRIRRWGAAAVVAVMVIGAASCSKPAEPVKIESINLSNAIDQNNHVVSLSETYAQQGTVYASIATEGAGEATLKARWLDPTGKVLTEQAQTVHPTQPSFFEFHYLPPGGWPVTGRYKAEFSIDGKDTRSREFQVR